MFFIEKNIFAVSRAKFVFSSQGVPENDTKKGKWDRFIPPPFQYFYPDFPNYHDMLCTGLEIIFKIWSDKISDG
jgi:hypothetical protein